MPSAKRRFNQLRPVKIQRGYTKYAAGSVLIKVGDTRVLCTAMAENSVPSWLKGKGKGWLSAEYNMLPGSSAQRIQRERSKVKGRTHEIERLIGRSLRAVLDLNALGERSIIIDCDVLQADGGTRTAAITGAYIALHDAVQHFKREKLIPTKTKVLTDTLAAVSVGIVKGKPTLDLNYEQDSNADTDMNVVMTGSGKLVEVQATAEHVAFSRKELDQLLNLAAGGIKQLQAIQKKHLR